MTKVPPPTFVPTPVLYSYVELNLANLAASSQVGDKDCKNSSKDGPSDTTPVMPLAAGELSQQTKDTLAAIFRKVGDKALTRDGIDDLYVFTLQHPEVDITPHLSKASDAFRLYIQRALARAAQTAAGRGGEETALDKTASEGTRLSALRERMRSINSREAPDALIVQQAESASASVSASSTVAALQARLCALRS